MQDLKITLIQSDLHWEDIEANLAMFEEKVWQIGSTTDVIVLPEMFTTGFTMAAPKLAEHMNMRTFKWMKAESLNYPTREELVAPFADVRDLGGLLQRAGFALPVTDLEPVTGPEGLRAARRQARAVHVSDASLQYVLALVAAVGDRY